MADALKLRTPLFKYLMASTTPAFTSFVIDGTTDECGWVFTVEKAMTITQVGFRVTAKTGTPGELTVSLNALTGTDGNPTGAILGGGSPASAAIASPSASFTATQFYWATLTNSYAAAAGETIGIKLDPTAGTWDGSNSVSIAIAIDGFGARVGIPYGVQAPAGTYSRVSGYPSFGVRSSTDTMGCPVEIFNSATIDSATSPNQIGFAFTLPSGWSSTYTLRGVMWLASKPVAADKNFDVVLYDSDGITELQVVNYDSEYVGTTTLNANYRTYEFFFDETTLSTLSFGTKYYLFIRPTSSTADLSVTDFGVRQASDMQAFPLGENCFYATKVNTATTPVETTTRRPMAGLIFDDITEPTGGAGGLKTHSGMSGGLVG